MRHFLTFVITIAFLFPALGLKVVKHTCNSCNTVEVYFFEKGYCPGCKSAHENEISCCGINETSESCQIESETSSCCTFEVKESDIDYYVVPSATSDEIQSKPIDTLFVSVELENTDENSSQFLKYDDPPLPSLSGIDFLFFINQLKIPIC